jgi:hypothetical protein
MNDFLYGWNAYIRKTFHSGSTLLPHNIMFIINGL